MRLVELKPKFVGSGGPGITDTLTGEPVPHRAGIGLMMNCPCRQCGQALFVPFRNPLDGGDPEKYGSLWTRTGEEFETMTLEPSIRRIPFSGSCGWHGFVRNGEVETCSDSIPATVEFSAVTRKYSDED